MLVLTYNVRAAKELKERLEATIGAAAASRLPVSNFHSFCHRILADNAAEAGLRPNPDVLDGIGQVLLLRDIRPSLPLVYHAGGGNPNYWLDQFVGFINRAKDELVTPDGFDAFVERERDAFQARFGSYATALDRITAQGILGADEGRSRRVRRLPAQGACRGARRGRRRVRLRRRSRRSPTARRGGPPAAPARPWAPASSAPDSSRTSPSSPTRTSPTARRSRSCGSASSASSTARTRRSWSAVARSTSASRSPRQRSC